MSGNETVTGIVEAALYVGDLDRAVAFYQDVFGFEIEVHAEMICVFRVPGRQALILFPRAIEQLPVVSPVGSIEGTIPPHGGSGRMHVAFCVAAAQLDSWRARLAARNVKIEGVVRWKRGGTSLFFRDTDEHLIELITPGLWSFY